MNWAGRGIRAVARVCLGSRYEESTQRYHRLRGRLARASVKLHPQRFADWRRLRPLRNAYAGRRCFVIGNGPSLNKTDITRLRDEVTIGCNGLFLLFDEMGFLPTFYTVEDNLVGEDRSEEINAIRGTTKIFPRDLCEFLLPDEDTYYCHFARGYPDFPRFSSRFAWIAYWGGTVTMMNLQLAHYIGCREVYLVGIDHSYRVPKDVDIEGDRGLVITSDEDDVNHFDPTYFGSGYRYHNPRVDIMEQGYRCAREFGERSGLSVMDATIDGHLNVFPKVNYDDLF